MHAHPGNAEIAQLDKDAMSFCRQVLRVISTYGSVVTNECAACWYDNS